MAIQWHCVPWIKGLVVSEPFELLTTTQLDGSRMPSGYGMTVQARLFRFEGASRSWHHEAATEQASRRRPWTGGMQGHVEDFRIRGPYSPDAEELYLLCLGTVRGEGDGREISVFEKPRPGKSQPRSRYYLTDWGPRHASLALRPILREHLPA